MKTKKMQEKKGAHSSWSASILQTTALLEVGSLGKTLLSSSVYHTWPTGPSNVTPKATCEKIEVKSCYVCACRAFTCTCVTPCIADAQGLRWELVNSHWDDR